MVQRMVKCELGSPECCCLKWSPVFICNTCLLICSYNCSFCYFKALNQNAELRSRLNRIHSESIICDQVVSVNIIPSPDEVRLVEERLENIYFVASELLHILVHFKRLFSINNIFSINTRVADSSVVFELKDVCVLDIMISW